MCLLQSANCQFINFYSFGKMSIRLIILINLIFNSKTLIMQRLMTVMVKFEYQGYRVMVIVMIRNNTFKVAGNLYQL